MRIASILAVALAIAGCQQAPAPTAAPPISITEVEAAKIADATVAAWTSMDAAKVKALYAPSVDGFDYGVAGLAGDRATWEKRQDVFAAAKLDGATQKERKIQILDADTFVMSGTWELTSKAIPANNGPIRCSDVFEKDAGGAWTIVNEHCSTPPRPA